MSSYQASVGSIASADKEPKDGKPVEPYGNLWKPGKYETNSDKHDLYNILETVSCLFLDYCSNS